MFRYKENVGRLIFVKPDDRTRYRFTLWFDYTRKLAVDIHEGDLVGIPNFATTGTEKHWSVVEIMSALPTHYALGSSERDMQGYPGFIMEAAGNLPVDWQEQESESLEDTTKIVCDAIPINLEFVEKAGTDSQSVEFLSESAIPMAGSEIRLLSKELTQRIVNHRIDRAREDTIRVGALVKEPGIDVYMRVEEGVKTHVGVFGFTGSGKSNLTSTLIAELLARTGRTTKIVVFDLNSEYTALLADQLASPSLDGMVVCLGQRTLPGPVVDYLLHPSEAALVRATLAYEADMYLPGGLRGVREQLQPRIRDLISGGRLRVVDDTISVNVSQFFQSIEEDVFDEYAKGALKIRLENLIEDIRGPREDVDLTPAVAGQMIADVLRIASLSGDGRTLAASGDPFQRRVGVIVSKLEGFAGSHRPIVPSSATTDLTSLIRTLNDPDRSALVVVQSHDPSAMRYFAGRLGYWAHENRRQKGLTGPTCMFVFDEADEFIPANASGSQLESKKIVETLARRGRKFGMGVLISTQRSAYLDTNIMGQLHTYFISRLPRQYDRDAVGAAFSLSEDIFRQTFKFQKGDWLFISHEAAGLDSTPIPIHARNSEERVREWVTARPAEKGA